MIHKAQSAQELWIEHDEKRKFQVFKIEHYGIQQFWIVVYSKPALERAENTTKKRVEKESENIKKELFHLQAERFSCEADAKKELEKKIKKWKFHLLANFSIETHKKHKSPGRPQGNKEPEALEYQVKAEFKKNELAIEEQLEENCCYVLGTNISESELSAHDIIDNYGKQGIVEQGFRFLKDPVFFVSSLFVKKPSRVQGLLMIMVLSLLVYSIAERRLRKRLKETNTTLPNQIKAEIQNPTLRSVFQQLEGINRVKICIEGKIQYMWNGITEARLKILRLFGEKVISIYQISSA